ncbi:MAG: fumarylacetoacetate hydrolase family protein [Bacteroidota bacterium]
MKLKELALKLDDAALHAKPIAQLSSQHPFSLDDAYAIQKLSLQRRYDRGEKRVGIKLGFTSKAKMTQMGVHDMIWGRLTDQMLIEAGGILPMDQYIHPRVEPEIAFLLKKPLDQSLTLGNAAEYVSGLSLAIEVIDSRYENFRFSLEDVVADNCSSTAFMVGNWLDVVTPIQDKAVVLRMDGEIAQEGNTQAILGNPWESLLAAGRLCLQYGEELTEGDIVLAGAATAASYVKAGQEVEVAIEGMGSLSLRIN